MKTPTAIVLTLLASLTSLAASQPTLQSVPQPLWYLHTAAEQPIQIMRVPKIFMSSDANGWIKLIASPTLAKPNGVDMNLTSVYGIVLTGEVGEPDGHVRKVVVDITEAKKPRRYPFSIREVTAAVVKCIRLAFPKSEATVIWVTDHDGSKPVEQAVGLDAE